MIETSRLVRFLVSFIFLLGPKLLSFFLIGSSSAIITTGNRLSSLYKFMRLFLSFEYLHHVSADCGQY